MTPTCDYVNPADTPEILINERHSSRPPGDHIIDYEQERKYEVYQIGDCC